MRKQKAVPPTKTGQSSPKPFVFVLMPFSEQFKEVYRYAIQATCKKLHLHCERVDEQVFEGSILDRIYNQIAKADLIISDMTGRNANVFYETGYAHALGKTVILLTKQPKDIPFDLAHYSHVIYSGGMEMLSKELEKRLKWWIDHPNDELSRPEVPVSVHIQGFDLNLQQDIPLTALPPIHEVVVDVGIHNQSNRIIRPHSFQVGIVSAGKYLGSAGFESEHRLPDNRTLHVIGANKSIFPAAWQFFRCSLQVVTFGVGDVHRFVVRLFTELGPRDYEFTLKGVAPERRDGSSAV